MKPTNQKKLTSALLCKLTALFLLCFSLQTEALPTFTVLHNMTGTDANPNGSLAQGRDGNLYGTNAGYDPGSLGSAFRLTPAGGYTRLHIFNSLTEGAHPSALTLGLDGNFYGTTAFGGANNGGAFFKMTPGGVVTVLHSFGIPNDGTMSGGVETFFPLGAIPPVQGRDGNFYGTTNSGGVVNGGVLYKLSPTTGAYTILHDFKGGINDGFKPFAPVIVGKDGNLYGTTSDGNNFNGTVFQYRLVTTSAAQLLFLPFSILHKFNPAIDSGSYLSSAPLVQGIDGNLYGTTNGTVFPTGQIETTGTLFKISPSGAFTNLHGFHVVTDIPNGGNPTAGLVQASDRNFYGVTGRGGIPINSFTFGEGVLFKITPQGVYTVLHAFDVLTEGKKPWQSLVAHTNGKLYGTTLFGQGNFDGGGMIFSFDVGARPFVTAQPSVGKAGDTINVFGDFTNFTSIKFNGINAVTIPSRGTTLKQVRVPTGPANGSITIYKPGQFFEIPASSSIKPFCVLPTLIGISPASGPIGTPVVLTGTGLSQATVVQFTGGLHAIFTVISDSQLTAFVPGGAKTGGVVVTTKGGSTKSIFDPTFTVTP